MQIKTVTINLFKAVQKKLGINSVRHPASLSWLQAKIHKHTDDFSQKNIKVNGLSIIYKHRHTLFHTFREIFIREIYKFKNENTHPLIIDCGANIGISILYFARHYPEAEIIGFEPDEENFKLLKNNIETNNFSNKISLIKKAVWTDNAGISFIANGTEGSKIGKSDVTAENVFVETESLKELLQKYNSIDFLKIDIEGAEYAVIKDCAAELPKVKNMFLEYHGLANETHKLKDLIAILNEQKFSVYITTAVDAIAKPFFDKKSINDFDVQLNIFCYRQ